MRVTSALPIVILALSLLACGQSTVTSRRMLILYPSPTGNASQTPYVQIVTSPPQMQTIVVTQTERPITSLCVRAAVAVYLRPTPSDDNYPVIELPADTLVIDLGGRDGNWYFVRYREYQGWVNGQYLEGCKP